MEKRILAVLIAAAWAGAAYAQTYQTDRNANAGRPAERSTAAIRHRRLMLMSARAQEW